MWIFSISLLLLQWALQTNAAGTSMNMMGNPIRKVVTMMQNMQGKIEAEGKEKEKMFDAYMCYCNGGDKSLAASIDAAETKMPQLESSIKEKTGSKAQLESEVAEAKKDREESSSALAKAKAIREKEASDFAAEEADSKASIGSLGKAISAISQGAGASFIQSNSGLTDKLRQLSVSMNMEAVDRDLLSSFLADGSKSEGSGEILGVLKQMHDEMSANLKESESQEAESIRNYNELTASKKDERAALTKAIETKTVRVGELAVSLAEHANDLEDTSESLVEDKAMLANLAKNCATKKKEWEAFKKAQSEELVALADTIKLLNDDDALELLKKTLPSAASSFMQVQVTTKSMQRKALQMLKQSHKGHRARDPRIGFLETALHGGQMGFEKMIAIIDGLMAQLNKEQAADDSKKSYCEAEFDKHADIEKRLVGDISDLAKAVDDAKESMKVLRKEIAALTQGIKDLDKSVGEATSARKKENADYTQALSQNTAAKELLEMARNRLNKFYQPAQYKEQAAPAPEAFLQVKSHRQPAADMSFEKKGEEGSAVVRMISMLIHDMDRDNQTLDLEEKEAQRDYETFMADAKNKRSVDAKTVTNKEAALGQTEAALEQSKLSSKDKTRELKETKNYVVGLHQECDFIIKFHDVRSKARSDELDSLDKAKAVLSGADYSFLQTSSIRLRGSQ